MDTKNYFRKRGAAFTYAFSGIWKLWRYEPHGLLHLLASVLVIVAGVFYRVSAIEWCLIAICIGGVMGLECVNTAIEKLADRITEEKDPLIGYAKDLGAAAVLLMALASVAVAAFIFIPKIFF